MNWVMRSVDMPNVIIPDRIGITVQYAVRGRKFEVKRLRRDIWHLRDLARSDRSRFGTRQQIAEDIAATLESGALPPPNGPRW